MQALSWRRRDWRSANSESQLRRGHTWLLPWLELLKSTFQQPSHRCCSIVKLRWVSCFLPELYVLWLKITIIMIICLMNELNNVIWWQKTCIFCMLNWSYWHCFVSCSSSLFPPLPVSQMLIVSSTEPRTLRNCDPPQVYRPSTDRPVGRTVPLRPMPRLPLQGRLLRVSTDPFKVLKLGMSSNIDPPILSVDSNLKM